MPIILLSPPLHFIPGILREKPIFVKALLPEPTVEGFYKSIVCWLPGVAEIQGYAVEISPLVKHLADEFRTALPTQSSTESLPSPMW